MSLRALRGFVIGRRFEVAVLVALGHVAAHVAGAQTLTGRGFVEGATFAYPQEAPNDPTRVIADVLARGEAFLKPASWLQFAAGADLRANSHDQVDYSSGVDFGDRGLRRPVLSVRRLAATIARGPLTIDVGKQFIRWGKADVVTPADRFAPRDFLNVVDSEFLAVTGARGVLQLSDDAIEAAWVPRFTPSRVPLLNQRWTVVPPEAAGLPLVDVERPLPRGSQAGVRWTHTGSAIEYGVSFFSGFNHLPNIDAAFPHVPRAIVVSRTYPPLRMYGGEAAAPTRWMTIKGEAAYFTSESTTADEYVLYVVQLERQTGEWVLVGGYAGEAVTKRRAALTFAPDRGMTRSIVGRASYTIDPLRSVAFETAIRQDGNGVYAKAEYSRAYGQRWRATVTGTILAGESNDFLGQYSRNSHVKLSVRYSF